MTTVAQRIMETPLAPYIGLLDSMTLEEKHIVLMYITESMYEPESDVVRQVRQKYGIAESESTKWFRNHAQGTSMQKRQEAWNSLTDKQREEAAKLNLSVEDMDERTAAIIEKHLK